MACLLTAAIVDDSLSFVADLERLYEIGGSEGLHIRVVVLSLHIIVSRQLGSGTSHGDKQRRTLSTALMSQDTKRPLLIEANLARPFGPMCLLMRIFERGVWPIVRISDRIRVEVFYQLK